MGRQRNPWRRWVALWTVLLCLAGCGPKPAIRIGFLGGLSNRTASFNEDARNGAMLAIEQRNQSGGVRGRPLELWVQDHGAGADGGPASFQTLLNDGVVAVIGPMTSEVAVRVVPMADSAGVLLLSPVVTAVSLAGKDDHFIRLNRTSRDHARDLAGMLYARGHRRLALAVDMRSPEYYVAWAHDLRQAFSALGGTVVAEAPLGQGAVTFESLLRTMLAGDPDGLVAICSSVDAALLAQQAAKQPVQLPMAAVAASEALLELGGRTVEGLIVAQPYNRADASPRYLAFHLAYVARFGRPPGYSAVASYDAVTLLAHAMQGAAPAETLRDAVLRQQPYQGLQGTIGFDGFGDSSRASFFSIVREGRLVPL